MKYDHVSHGGSQNLLRIKKIEMIRFVTQAMFTPEDPKFLQKTGRTLKLIEIDFLCKSYITLLHSHRSEGIECDRNNAVAQLC